MPLIREKISVKAVPNYYLGIEDGSLPAPSNVD